MTIDPYHVRKLSEWSEADFDLDDLVLPETPQWHRCGAVHCIDQGPWLGTLVCCIRRSGHVDAHSMSLGDAGAPDHWDETWLQHRRATLTADPRADAGDQGRSTTA